MHISFSPDEPSLPLISFEDFLKVDIRMGEITSVEDFPEARKPSYKLIIDFGPGVGKKKSSAQITHHYKKEDLLNKKVMAVVNFPPRQIGKFLSEVLVLGFSDLNQDVVLPSLTSNIPKGSRLH
jgi:tRNA-binding protein